MKKAYFMWMLLAVLFVQASHAERLGVNINLVERGGTFVDMIKENHRYLNPTTWAALADEQFDELGWPKADALLLMDQRPVAAWAGEIDDPEYYQVDRFGTYLGSLTGKATVRSSGEGTVTDVVYDEASNTTTFKFTIGEPYEGDYGFMGLAFTNTQRAPDESMNSGFTNLKLIRPGYDADTEQIFMNELIDALTQPKFESIRFKDFLGTDSCDPYYPAQTEWEDRSLPEHASQLRIDAIGKRAGAAWEYVIELANITEIDPWINIPVSASQDYITQLANFLKENLNPDLNIYVESSNEVWNTAPAFEQSQYNKDQANDLGIGEHNNHARRTVEIAQIFKGVYGEGSLNDKIRVVLCSHAPMLKWWVQGALDYLEENYSPINQYIYALACQSYFSGGADEGESIEKILQDCRQSITDQIDEPSGGQSGRKQWIAKAKKYGLVGGFCFYEGGPDHGGGSTVNIANRIGAERSEEMAEVFKYNYNDGFFEIGGNLAIQFTLTSSYNRYGCWGLTDDIMMPDRNYKFQAAREILAQPVQVESDRQVVMNFALGDNYPNPFNPSTLFTFSLPSDQHVRINIYDIRGALVETLIDQHQSVGSHQVLFDASNLASGVYIYEISTAGQSMQKKCLYIK